MLIFSPSKEWRFVDGFQMFGLWTERNLRKNWGTGTSTGLKPTGFSSSGIPQHIVKRQLHFPDPRWSMVFHGVPQTKTEFGAFFHKLSQESRLLAPQSRGRLKRAALSSNCKYSSQNLHRVAKKKAIADSTDSIVKNNSIQPFRPVICESTGKSCCPSRADVVLSAQFI